MKIGLELEYWVVDERGRLTAVDELVAAHPCVTHEFVDSLLEIRVPPAETAIHLRWLVTEILSTVLAAANNCGKRLVPLGTPLSTHDLPIITKRGRILERIYGAELQYAKHCAGTHIHFDRRNERRQLNLLTALDPAIALVNSSPYYDGEQIASSSRASVYRLDSTSQFSRYRDLWIYADTLSEWETRITSAYEILETTARESGISDAAFAKCFCPENTVLTPVRLREVPPTIEWRAPDTAVPSQIIRLADDVADLLSLTNDKEVVIGDSAPGIGTGSIVIPRFTELRTLSESAISDGLRSEAVRAYLRAFGFDISSYAPLAEEIEIENGTAVTEEEARALRLRYAGRLEADVASLAPTTRRVPRKVT